MNLILGMIVRNEADMLALTLPVTRGLSTLKLALDFASTDTTRDILASHDWTVIDGGAWRNDYAGARNDLLECGLTLAPSPRTWMLQLDADECMWPEAIDLVDVASRDVHANLLSLPRYNLAGRGTLYDSGSYPDPQTRVVWLSSDARYRLPVHEVIDGPRHHVSDAPIFHYGWEKSPRANWLRSHNYTLIAKGEPTLDSPPSWVHDDYDRWLVDMKSRHIFSPFTHNHPLHDKL